MKHILDKQMHINALGIFGRLEPKQEKYFSELEVKYSKRPKNDENTIYSSNSYK